MSALYGFLHRRSQQVDICDLDAMQQALNYWQADKEGRWINGPIALGQKLLWNTPESCDESFPRKQQHVVICMDARLDNRDKLIRQLAIRPAESAAMITDSDIILAAYAHWGAHCAEHLLGDFAFVVWDKVKQQLFCARDHVGIKPFYYYLSDQYFVFASDLRAVVAHCAVRNKLNDAAVANYLKNSLLTDIEITFFQDVCKLKPGHTMTVTKSTVNTRCYWCIEDSPKVQLKNAQAYALRLRQLLEQAVHDRMRSAYPITSHLSGGLDSSSIAVIAARRLKSQGKRLLSFNWVPAPKATDDPNHHEWANSRVIAEAEGIEHYYVNIDTADVVEYIRSNNIAYGDSSGFAYEVKVRLAAKQHHSRTIFSGWGGDEFASSHAPAFFADMFRRGRWCCLFKNMVMLAKKQARPWRTFLGLCYHRILLPFVPRRYYHCMPFVTTDYSKKFLYPTLDANFLSQWQNYFNQPAVLTLQPYTTMRQQMISSLRNGHLQGRVESWAAGAYAHQLQYVYPLLDKRILEFMVGVPARCFIQQGQKRALYRETVRPYIGKIFDQQSKVEEARVLRIVELIISSTYQLFDQLCCHEFKSSYINIHTFKRVLASVDLKPSLEVDTLMKASMIFYILSVLFTDNRLQFKSIQEPAMV